MKYVFYLSQNPLRDIQYCVILSNVILFFFILFFFFVFGHIKAVILFNIP